MALLGKGTVHAGVDGLKILLSLTKRMVQVHALWGEETRVEHFVVVNPLSIVGHGVRDLTIQ